MRRGIASAASAPLTLCCLLTLAATTACVKLPRAAVHESTSTTRPESEGEAATRININTASPGELERLPGVGPALAARIVEHRERHGPFRRAEHLLIVRGVSESRFRELRHSIRVD